MDTARVATSLNQKSIFDDFAIFAIKWLQEPGWDDPRKAFCGLQG
jgi:hypothetical protein